MKIADIHAHIFPHKLAEKASASIGDFYGMHSKNTASLETLMRLESEAGIGRFAVSSSATTASQVRQDFNCFGGFGQQGIGYKVDVLLAEIGKLLFGNGELLPTVLIGAGRLGTAVSSFISRDTNGYKLIAAFDINPALEGKEISGVTIRPLSELESFCAAHKPVVAVLCVPRQSAMDLSDELVRLGIQGFWNFSHYDLSVVYPQVTVENVHLGDSLMSLGYRLRSHDE